jgi:hypothetical protein
MTDAVGLMYETLLDCRSGVDDLGPRLDALHAALSSPPEPLVTDENRPIFDVIALAVADLRRLEARGERLVIRNLGYALHNLPNLLHKPGDFSPSSFMFSLRFAAFGWAHLSSDLKLALTRLLRLTPERLEEIVSSEGFASSQYDP